MTTAVLRKGSGPAIIVQPFGLQTLAQACPGLVVAFESGNGMLPASGLPANATSWTDEIGASLQLVPGSTGHCARTASPGASMSFTGSDATQRLTCTLPQPITSVTDFAIVARFNGVLFTNAFSISSPTHPSLFATYGSTSVAAAINDGAAEDDATLTVTADTALHTYFIERSGTTLSIRQDASSPATHATTKDMTHGTILTLGCAILPSGAAYLPGTCAVSDWAYIPDRPFTAPERAAILAYIAGRTV